MSGKRLLLRLFLEGVEVPVVAATATGGDGTPGTAVLQVVATDDIHNLKPRTLVHLVFLDLYPSPEVLEAVSMADTAGYAGLPDAVQETLAAGYVLLFTGEFVRYSLQRSASGRSVMLQCLDMSSYWDLAKQYYMTGGTEEGGARSKMAKAAAFMGAGVSATGFANEDSGSATERLVTLLTSKSSSTPGADGALGGVIRLLESIGGIFRGNNKFHGLNDVFSAAELRLRLSQMLGVPFGDDTTKALLNHKTFRQWLRATLSRNKGTVSFRQILEIVLARVYHTHASVLAPPLRKGRSGTLQVRVPIKAKVKAPVHEAVQRRIDELERYEAAGESGEDSNSLQDAVAAGAENAEGQAATDLGTIDTVVTPDAKHNYSLATGSDRALRELVTAYGEGGDLGAIKQLAEKTLKLYRKGAGVSGFRLEEKSVFYSDRLITNILLPNIYFCAPPRCNVFFPDIYSSFSYSRGFLEEITRLELTAQKEVQLDSLSPDPSTTVKYWAPNIAAASGDLAAAARKGARIVLPHERFTGIIPDFESVPDISAFQKIDSAEGGRRKIPYMQRVAAFNFFEKRFAPRTANVEAPFNPYLIAALPALIIDQHRSDAVRKSLNITPTQYLGKIAGFTHAINQGGGTTSVQLTHCRTHDERLEYLGPFINSFWEVVGSKRFELTLDSVSGGLRNLTDVGDVAAIADMAKRSNQLTELGSGLVGTPIKFSSGGKVDVKATVTRVSTVVGGLDGSVGLPDGVGSIDTVIVEAVKNVYAKRQEEVPVEEGIFPPWLSPIYTNARIGPEYYQDLFAVGSICDELSPLTFDVAQGMAAHGPPPPARNAAGESLAALASAAKVARKEGREGEARELQSRARGKSISTAVDELVAEYARIKEAGIPFADFYKNYSWRPIATLRQVLGAHDFDLSKQPTNAPLYVGSMLPGGSASTVQGAEGFHSRAFGPYANMEYLEHPETSFAGLLAARKVDPAADPRKERYMAVLAYAAVLKADRGLLG